MKHDKTKSDKDRELTKSLEETFPASDAVSSNETEEKPVRPVHRKPATIDSALVEHLAEEVARKQKP